MNFHSPNGSAILQRHLLWKTPDRKAPHSGAEVEPGREAFEGATQNRDGSFGEREHSLSRDVDGRNYEWQVWIGVCGGIRTVPNVLVAAERVHGNCAGKMSDPAAAFKGDSNGVCIISISIDEQQGPLAIWAPKRHSL
jgi:hypothetical protein